MKKYIVFLEYHDGSKDYEYVNNSVESSDFIKKCSENKDDRKLIRYGVAEIGMISNV